MMLKQPLVISQNNVTSLFTSPSPAVLPSGTAAGRLGAAAAGHVRSKRTHRLPRIRCSTADKAVGTVTASGEKVLSVKAVVTVTPPIGEVYAARGFDDLGDLLGKTLKLELFSSELEPKTGAQKAPVSGFAHTTTKAGTYEAKFTVPANFGPVGAIRVENEHHREMFLKDIVLITGDDGSSSVTFHSDSWVHSKFDNPNTRIFFSTKCYLPSETPKGIEPLRKEDLDAARGDGRGERKVFERIYDYDVYNDLGNPDHDPDLARPVVGGKEYPYPRRCRTGRPRAKKDPASEQRTNSVYVPRDEQFSEVKGLTFGATTLRSGLHAIVPALEPLLIKKKLRFAHFPQIDSLYSDGIPLPRAKGFELIRTIVPRVIKFVEDTTEHILRFETPELVHRDRFSWFRDEEFARQTLAGLNPICIQLLTEFPIVSKLDPEVYGPAESLLTKELIETQIKGLITVEEALDQKRLFILDYNDVFLPYVHKVREQEDTSLYGSRTLFFLTEEGTLEPLAIELTRPKSPSKPAWRRVFTHGCDSTESWLWKLAKAHVLAHDTGYHQLVSHWLRTHCCVEPYIIAANRQMSAMHPIHRLLHPHFRYTMEINALARESLINAGGIIEKSFWPGKYSIELSSVAYDKTWQFDTEALPNDLIKRGMAYEENGELKLTIQDYPYANDGLLVWNSIKEWASDYVGHYYKSAADITGDEELQAWWTEVRTKGHADKKDEPWWPVLDSHENLVQVLTTIMWVTSGHHAAVNFGQYHFGGYFPNRPTIIRKNMPVEDNHEQDLKRFHEKPEEMLLEFLPNQMQAITVMTTLDILSSHSPDEEYMGEYAEPAWMAEPMIKAAFEKFSGRMKEIEGVVDERNATPELKNRCGAGVVPYELLKPFSEHGVTGRGIPNSISI